MTVKEARQPLGRLKRVKESETALCLSLLCLYVFMTRAIIWGQLCTDIKATLGSSLSPSHYGVVDGNKGSVG